MQMKEHGFRTCRSSSSSILSAVLERASSSSPFFEEISDFTFPDFALSLRLRSDCDTKEADHIVVSEVSIKIEGLIKNVLLF